MLGWPVLPRGYLNAPRCDAELLGPVVRHHKHLKAWDRLPRETSIFAPAVTMIGMPQSLRCAALQCTIPSTTTAMTQ